MARAIKPHQDYISKLLKLIPSEIIAAFLVLHSILEGQTIQVGEADLTRLVAWLVFGALFILTPVYLVRINKVFNISQLILTTISFAVWAYTLGGPFKIEGWYQPQLAAVILVLWTLIIPLIIKVEPTNQLATG